MKATSVKKVLILVTILAVPGFLYYLLQDQGKNRYKPLPFFGPKKVASTFHSVRGQQIPDTIYHVIKGLKFLNQEGKSVTWEDYKNKVLVIGLFYSQSNDRQSVQAANTAMKKLNVNYAKNQAVGFISMSIDPVYDQPAVLSKYADSISAKAGKWDLLTGDSTEMTTFINEQLLIDAHQAYATATKKFAYSNYFILVDPQHRIRGFYEVSHNEAMAKLDDEIKVLLAEVLRNTKDGR